MVVNDRHPAARSRSRLTRRQYDVPYRVAYTIEKFI